MYAESITKLVLLIKIIPKNARILLISTLWELIHKKSKNSKMQIDKKCKNTKRTKHAKRATK